MTTTDSRTRSLIDVDVLEYHRLLTPEQQEKLGEIRAALAEIVTPHVAEAWSRDEFPHEIARRVGELGYNHISGMTEDPLFRGHLMAELARADISLSVYFALHNDLVGATLEALGSEEQKQTWLPGLYAMEYTGCFALTEPEHGSDVAGGMATTARREGAAPEEGGPVFPRWLSNEGRTPPAARRHGDTAPRRAPDQFDTSGAGRPSPRSGASVRSMMPSSRSTSSRSSAGAPSTA